MSTLELIDALVISPALETFIILFFWRLYIAVFCDSIRPGHVRPYLIYLILSIAVWALIHGLAYSHLGTGIASGLAFGCFCALMFWLERRHSDGFVFVYLTLAHVSANAVAVVSRVT